MSRRKSSKKLRLCLLIPASLAAGLMASEVSKGLPRQVEEERPEIQQADAHDGSAEWLVGRSAAMAISNAPLVERTQQ